MLMINLCQCNYDQIRSVELYVWRISLYLWESLIPHFIPVFSRRILCPLPESAVPLHSALSRKSLELRMTILIQTKSRYFS